MFAALKPYLMWIKLGAAALTVAVAFGSGWVIKGWKDKSQEAAETALVQRVIDSRHASDLAIAKLVGDKLAKLTANQTRVENYRETITERAPYKLDCLDADGVRLIEQARTGHLPAGGASAPVP